MTQSPLQKRKLLRTALVYPVLMLAALFGILAVFAHVLINGYSG